jgi:hypothetical protein
MGFEIGVGAALTGLFTTATTGFAGIAAGAIAGAIDMAIVGAVVGGLTSAVTGGDIMSGVLVGAIGGAVTGGVLGAFNPSAFGVGGAAEFAGIGDAVSYSTIPDATGKLAGADALYSTQGVGEMTGLYGGDAAGGGLAGIGGNLGAGAVQSLGGGLGEIVAGGVKEGAGAMMAGKAASDQQEAQFAENQRVRDAELQALREKLASDQAIASMQANTAAATSYKPQTLASTIAQTTAAENQQAKEYLELNKARAIRSGAAKSLGRKGNLNSAPELTAREKEVLIAQSGVLGEAEYTDPTEAALAAQAAA